MEVLHRNRLPELSPNAQALIAEAEGFVLYGRPTDYLHERTNEDHGFVLPLGVVLTPAQRVEAVATAITDSFDRVFKDCVEGKNHPLVVSTEPYYDLLVAGKKSAAYYRRNGQSIDPTPDYTDVHAVSSQVYREGFKKPYVNELHGYAWKIVENGRFLAKPDESRQEKFLERLRHEHHHRHRLHLFIGGAIASGLGGLSVESDLTGHPRDVPFWGIASAVALIGTGIQRHKDQLKTP